ISKEALATIRVIYKWYATGSIQGPYLKTNTGKETQLCFHIWLHFYYRISISLVGCKRRRRECTYTKCGRGTVALVQGGFASQFKIEPYGQAHLHGSACNRIIDRITCSRFVILFHTFIIPNQHIENTIDTDSYQCRFAQAGHRDMCTHG